MRHVLPLVLVATVFACSPAPDGIAPAQPANTTVRMDFFHKPLPEIPLPNDVATRFDVTSATGLRINASHIAPTGFEGRVRELLDQLDGWGTLQPIVIPFTGPLQVESIIMAHSDPNYGVDDDIMYLINVDPDSEELGRIHHLDLGSRNYPLTLERRDRYWRNDPRADTMTLVFEEVDEDTNGNGVLDPGEDTDADGTLDKPNYLPGMNPAIDDYAGRADALMTFYEKETYTIIAKPLMPLLERTRYAVVVTKRLLDANGESVGSPYEFINHTSQTEALKNLADHLPASTPLSEVAFAFTYTTQSVASSWKAIRDGLYGIGPQKHIAELVPAKIESLLPLRDEASFPTSKMLHLLWGEAWARVVPTLMTSFFGMNVNDDAYITFAEGNGYVDYYVMGAFKSPQLYSRCGFSVARTDCDPKDWIALNDQSWPPDLDRVPAPVEAELVYFTLAVPRKEVSARGQGKPAPIVMMGHGHTGSRFDAMQFAHFMARYGVGVLSIDGPGHGIGIDAATTDLVRQIFQAVGIGATGTALANGRVEDQNGDGVGDSGADFWTAYFFHTRDSVRQFTLDYMQLIKLFRSFDGVRRWDLDVNGDGENELAGDFDADGVVDVGGPDVMFAMSGGSLGGMISAVLGAVEPELALVAPISAGGLYSDIGIRSDLGGVNVPFILRGMGPLWIGTGLDTMTIETVVPNLGSPATVLVGQITGVLEGDLLVAENLANGERGCGYVNASGQVRAAVASDYGDATQLLFYHDVQVIEGSDDCEIDGNSQAYETITQFNVDTTYQDDTITAGDELRALEEGLGLRRAHPDFRRVQGIAQLVLGPADPAVLARHIQQSPIEYDTGDRTAAHILIMTSMGDMSVPTSSGITLARAAGLIDYLNDDPRYGKPVNQELIDQYVVEGVDTLKRHTNATTGEGVLIDIENFAQGTDLYGTDIPRLSEPMHLGIGELDMFGGVSAAVIPYTLPGGQHGFNMPGVMTDEYRVKCKAECQLTGGADPCACDQDDTFDIGKFLFGMFMRYAVSGGTELSLDLCQSRNDCADALPLPPVRSLSSLD